MKTLLACAALAALTSAAVPAQAEDGFRALPLEAEAWRAHNPLGGEFTGAAYVCDAAHAQPFATCKAEPASSNVVFAADVIPGETVGGDWKTAAIGLFEGEGRFWHLSFVVTPDGRRSFELCEMRDGKWLAQQSLRSLACEQRGAWRPGERYRLSIALGDGACEGRVADAKGTLVYRRSFALAGDAVSTGRPLLKGYGLTVTYANAQVRRRGAVPDAKSGSGKAEKAPAYETPPSIAAVRAPREKATGFFRVGRDAEGRACFIDPNGCPFFMAAASSLNHQGDYNARLGYAPYGRAIRAKFKGDFDAWGRDVSRRLIGWGFTAVCGADSAARHKGLPHANIVAIGQEMASSGDAHDILPCDGGPCTAFPNVFSPRFPAYCRYMAEKKCAPVRNDPWVIGHFIDNELSWWGDARQFRTKPSRGIFDAAAKKSPGHSARQALDRFLAARGVSSPDKAGDADRLAFVRLAAHVYFEETTKAIRAADPNHLVLGCRFAGLRSSDPVVWEECGRFCDVISVNVYPVADLDRRCVFAGQRPDAEKIEDQLRSCAKVGQRPVIVTEWSFTALDSGLPCLHGAGQRFFTQAERAQAVGLFAQTLYAMPEVAGYVFFKWNDQSWCGRKGPESENSNYGLVNADDEAYAEVTAALAALQRDPAKARRAKAPEPIPVTRTDPLSFARSARREGDGPVYRQEPDGSFSLANGRVALTGRIGGRGVDVNALGKFGVAIRERKGAAMWWSSAMKVVAANGGTQDGVGRLDVTLEGRARYSGAFRVTASLCLPRGRDFFSAAYGKVVNASDKTLEVDQVFARFNPPDSSLASGAKAAPDAVMPPPKDGQPTPIPPSLWMPWTSGAWLLPEGGAIGLCATRLSGVTVRFWEDPAHDSLHSDAVRSFGRTAIAPAGEAALDPCAFVVGAALRGGLESWRRAYGEIRAVGR